MLRRDLLVDAHPRTCTCVYDTYVHVPSIAGHVGGLLEPLVGIPEVKWRWVELMADKESRNSMRLASPRRSPWWYETDRITESAFLPFCSAGV